MANQPNQKVVTKKHLARLEKERIQRRYLLIGTAIVAVLVVGILLYGILDQTVLKSIRPVARVGSDSISTAQFQKEVKFQRYRLLEQLKGMTSDPTAIQFFGSYIQQISSQLNSPTTLGQQVLDLLIEDNLIAKEAKKRGITVSEAEVDTAFHEAFGFYPNGTSTPTITPTEFSTETLSPLQQTLLPPTSTPNPTSTPAATEAAAEAATGTPTEQTTPTSAATSAPAVTETPAVTGTPAATATITPTPTPYTLEGFNKELDKYTGNLKSIGYTQDDLRALIRKQVLRNKVYEAIIKDAPKTAAQIWARHILVATEDEAKKVEERLAKGEKFDDLAKELTTDTSSKEQGGDLGWFTKGKMVAAFEDVAFKLKVGETSQPVKTDFGYHVIQVLGHEENRPLSSTQLQEAQQKVYQDWLDGAKKAANVQTLDTMAKVVPTEPAIPADLENLISQMNQSQSQQFQIPTVDPALQQTPAP